MPFRCSQRKYVLFRLYFPKAIKLNIIENIYVPANNLANVIFPYCQCTIQHYVYLIISICIKYKMQESVIFKIHYKLRQEEILPCNDSIIHRLHFDLQPHVLYLYKKIKRVRKRTTSIICFCVCRNDMNHVTYLPMYYRLPGTVSQKTIPHAYKRQVTSQWFITILISE